MTAHKLAWHVHHDVVVEPVLAPLEERREQIRDCKPEAEVPLRLRLLKEVRGNLPDAVEQAALAACQAWAACLLARAAHRSTWAACLLASAARELAKDAFQEASAAYGLADAVYGKAQVAYGRALRDNMPAVLALHAVECPDCPWDGQSIFGLGEPVHPK